MVIKTIEMKLIFAGVIVVKVLIVTTTVVQILVTAVIAGIIAGTSEVFVVLLVTFVEKAIECELVSMLLIGVVLVTN